MKSEPVYVLATLVLFLSCLCLGTAHAQPSPPYFIDDFEDGSATDGMPVTWVAAPPFDTGSREVVNGDYVLTPEAATIGSEMDSVVDGLVFGDVSLQTLVRSNGEGNWVGIAGRSTFAGTLVGESVWGGFRTDGFLFIGKSTNAVDGILDSQTLGHGLANQDVHLQLDIFGTDLSLTMWLDGEEKPSMPQLNAPILLSPSEGTIGVFIAPTDTTLTPVAFEFFAAVNAPCDFTSDGLCDVTDLDLMQLLGPIATGVSAAGNEEYDLNDDGTIDLIDRDQWLADAATENGFGSPYKLGDANIDGFVDGTDFIAWNGAKFTGSLLWSDGNFNADSFVDGQDFILWNANKFTSSDGISAVPEPGAGMLSILGLSLLGWARIRR